jgi:pimeloyl-ACP methyl ester carboxylesterase
MGPVTRIVLVHGAWHDGSCWDRVVDELAVLGHDGVAVDLPSARPGLGAAEYADVVAEAAGAATPVVLVGHSLGGLTVPVAAQRLGEHRISALVLVAALLPRPGWASDDQLRADRTIMVHGFGRGQVRHADGTTSWPPTAAVAGLYRGVADESSPEVVDAAVARLRPQAWQVTAETTPLRTWPAVPTTVVICARDQVVDPASLRRRAADIPGARVVELAGGHFPMLTRPRELAEVLDGVARTIPTG